MNKEEYDVFVCDFNVGMQSYISFSTIEDAEPHFSSKDCDVHGGHLAGNRTSCYAESADDNQIYIIEVCDDCIYYNEYGRLDDATMLEIEESE